MKLFFTNILFCLLIAYIPTENPKYERQILKEEAFDFLISVKNKLFNSENIIKIEITFNLKVQY